MFVSKIKSALAVVLALGGIALGVSLSTNSIAVAQQGTGDQALDGLWEDIENKGGWLRFEGSTIKYHPAGKSDEIIKWTCRYNLTLTPMTIDIFENNGTAHGIFVVERGTLFIALAKAGNERPPRFQRDEATKLFILKRKRADEKEKSKTEGKAPDVGDAGANGKLANATLALRKVEASYAEAQKTHLAAKARFEQMAENVKANENKHTGKDDNKSWVERQELNLARAELKLTEALLEVERSKCVVARARLMDVELEGGNGKADENPPTTTHKPVVGVPQVDMPKVVSGQMIVHGILESVDAKKSVATVKAVVGNDASSVMRLMALVSDKPVKGGTADALLKEIGPDNYPKLVNVPVRANGDGVIGTGVGFAKLKLKLEDLKAGQVVMLQLAADRTTGFVVVFVRVLSE
jgi:hypothetical protein